MTNCIICHAPAPVPIEAYSSLPRVGSDSRPLAPGGRLVRCEQCGAVQKPVDDLFLAECEAIYASYVMYGQSSDGAEPKVFDHAACGRSTRLMEAVGGAVELTETGRLLDVGCGNGNLLRAFGRLRPQWSMAGLELDDRHGEVVEHICGKGGLLIGDLADVDGRFDVITAMHVLEHVTEPVKFLGQVRDRLTAGGMVVIQLPLWRRNPFDLVVADHCVHYDGPTLVRILDAAGFLPVFVSEDAVPRELTVIARPGQGTVHEEGTAGDNIHAAVHWLEVTLGNAIQAMEMAGRENFGIFGTGNAAMWLTQGLGGVGFYVDDDPSRQGESGLTGCPVHAPENVPEGATVFICLPSELSELVFERVRGLPVNWLRTPPLEILNVT